MKIRHFIMSSQNVARDSYIWNMAAGLLQAFQSVIMLMILTRTVGLVEAGIFTIAYANANLFLNIGKYGMHNFQVSDVKNQFSFAEYLLTRKCTVLLMLILSVLYVEYAACVNHYSLEKSMVIIWMCIYKSSDAVEDVYCSLYQKKGRLDIGAKVMTLRLGITIAIFGAGIFIFRNQLVALVWAAVCSWVLLCVFIIWTYGSFEEKVERVEWKHCGLLLKSCLPLCMGAFLSFYIGNAPKYAIDALLSDELQACYGFVAMPVFVIGLLNNFIFNPILFQVAELWEKKQIKELLKRIFLQTGIILLITLVCLLGANLIGTPILSLLYHADLRPYKRELLILLVGGGFLGLSGFLYTMITIIRFQKSIVLGYGIVALLAYIFSVPVVERYGILGAALLYLGLMIMLCICFLIILGVGLVYEIKKRDDY